MTERLKEAMEDALADQPPALANLKCARCKEKVMRRPTLVATTLVNWYIPATGDRQRVILCTPCALDFQEFMLPELERDEVFQRAKAEVPR